MGYKRGKDNINWINRIIKICEHCGCEYEVEQRLVRISKFCSKQCRYDHDSKRFKGENNPNYKGGVSPERQCLYASRMWNEIKKNIFERDEYKCKRCGDTGTIKNYSLRIHHIIPFEVEATRLDIDNMVLLCRNCHKFVHSKKNLNNEFL